MKDFEIEKLSWVIRVGLIQEGAGRSEGEKESEDEAGGRDVGPGAKARGQILLCTLQREAAPAETLISTWGGPFGKCKRICVVFSH